MLCPICKTTKLAISSREGIEIDYCPDCRGVWLDRGELDKLIEKAYANMHSSNPQPQVNPTQYSNPNNGYNAGYNNQHNSQYKHKKKDNDGWFGEIFDF
jgi:uncharacterized protein